MVGGHDRITVHIPFVFLFSFENGFTVVGGHEKVVPYLRHSSSIS